jgi:hypothetical protein
MWVRNLSESVTWIFCSKRIPISRDAARYVACFLFDWVPMHLAIVGYRGFTDETVFMETMQAFVAKYGLPELVVSGGAAGADTMGELWAAICGIPTRILTPDWRRYGRAAGLMRNTDIVAACTHMVAFPSIHGKGTQDSIRKAQQAKKVVVIKNV